MKNLIYYTLISTLFVTSSCKTKKTVIGTGKNYKSSKLFKKIEKSNIDYDWYSYKSSATVFYEGTTIGGMLEIRIKKDEVIWMSVKKFGFEIARVLIRPDSVFIIDRFNGKYMTKSFDKFKNQYDIPVDFNTLQELLVANSIIKGQKPVVGEIKDQIYTLKTRGQDISILYQMDSKYKVLKTKFKNKNDKSLEIDFSNFKLKKGKEIPYRRKYSFPNSTNPKYFLNLKIKDINKNKVQKIKFEIPKKYTKM